jgi:AbrB family looped-hinge helix DNA binding protein
MTLQIDPLGRVVLPKILRESLRLHSGDHLNARLEDGRIVLEPMSVEGLIERDGMLIWTGEIDQSVDVIAQSRAERDAHVLGS